MTTPNVIARACLAWTSSCSGRNQMMRGMITDKTRPSMTTETGGRSSKTAAGAVSAAMVSVVKQACLPQHVVERFFSAGVERDQRQPHFGCSQKTEPGHHGPGRD